MSECEEVAENMLPRYRDWLNVWKRANNATSVRQFVDERMSDDGHTVRDNVVYALLTLAGVVKPVARSDSPGDSPLAGSW